MRRRLREEQQRGDQSQSRANRRRNDQNLRQRPPKGRQKRAYRQKQIGNDGPEDLDERELGICGAQPGLFMLVT
jgi:hypothetical protein